MMRATGLDDQAIAQPLVAVVNTWSEVTPCNIHLRKLAEPVNLLAIGDITGCRLLRSLRYMVKTTRIERRN